MTAVLWDDVAADLASAKRHFAEGVRLYRSRFGAGDDYVIGMAFQHAMQAGFTSFEAALRRILNLLGEPLPSGPDWHTALLRRLARPVEGSRPALLDAEMLAAAEALRAFRHVAMHSYDSFDPRRAAGPVEAAEMFLARIESTMARFRAALDPLP